MLAEMAVLKGILEIRGGLLTAKPAIHSETSISRAYRAALSLCQIPSQGWVIGVDRGDS